MRKKMFFMLLSCVILLSVQTVLPAEPVSAAETVLSEQIPETEEHAESDETPVFNSVPEIVKLKTGLSTLKVTWGRNRLGRIRAAFNGGRYRPAGVEIQVATDKKFRNIVKDVKRSASCSSRCLKKLKSNYRYYVRVRAYIHCTSLEGRPYYYSDWSAVRSAKTLK